MKIKLLLILIAFVCIKTNAQNVETKNLVNIFQAPLGSLVPDVAMDSKGTLHFVYVKNQNAYYIRSTDNGTTFNSPVKVNSSGTVVFKMGERGPKLAVGEDGVIHVAWMDQWYAGVNVFTRYSRSLDGGKTFEPLKTISATPGVDGVSIAADGKKHVFIFWHTMVPMQSVVPQATWLHFAKSADNGVSFSVDTNVVVSNHSGLACSMCMTRARFGADGNVYLAFRSAESKIRDFYVLKGNPEGTNFSAIRVNNDNWTIDYCPMVGPELQISGDGSQLCAYMSNGHVYWSVSDKDVSAFSLHIATPTKEPNELYPTAIANKSGKVLFLWQVGPMSVTDSSTVKWALYNYDGTYAEQQGIVAKTFSGTKGTAFVGTDDNFYIVVNDENLTNVFDIQDFPDVSLFPNPAWNNVSLFPDKYYGLIEIFNQVGIKEYESDCNSKIDISRLSSGVYFLKAGDKIFKFVKK